jgi:hypothetical protein
MKKRRGRKYNPNSKRNQTTRAGRRGEVDEGSPLLIQKKVRLTGRGDCELDGSGVLFGRGLIDRQQYDELGLVTLLLRRVAAAMGRGTSVAGLWSAIIAAASWSGYTLPLLGDMNARRTLERMCGCLNGSRALVIDLAEGRLPPIVLRAATQRLLPEDATALEELRAGLDDLAAPRRSPRYITVHQDAR